MGLSAFWTAIKRPRVSEAPSRKHSERKSNSHNNHISHNKQTDSAARETGDSSPHHLDAIYDTHHHIIPHTKGGPKRHPSSPPRIHSPTSKQQKRASLWKSHSVKVKPSPQASDEIQPTKTIGKRRSFWRSDSKATSKAPAVQAPDTGLAPLTRTETTGIAYEDTHLFASSSGSTSTKAKRSSLRLSLRRTVSSKSSRSRLSWLGGRVDDSDDEEIPALPPIPVNLKREKSRSQDPGRNLGMADSFALPGTAITSDDVHGAVQSPTKKVSNRQSLSSILTKRKSISTLPPQDQGSNSNKRKRRSWFSVHSPTDDSPDTALPPVPALPGDSEQTTVDPSEMAFHRFLHNIHNARPQAATSDYERFLVASRAYDDSRPSPTLLSHTNSRSTAHTSLQAGPPGSMALHPALKRSTYAAPRARRSRASHCRPQTGQLDESQGHAFLTVEQQHEWNKLRDLLDDTIKTVSPTSSLDDEDDDGVMGMMREYNREEEREMRHRAQQSRRDRERGYGAWANDDALARLEFGR